MGITRTISNYQYIASLVLFILELNGRSQGVSTQSTQPVASQTSTSPLIKQDPVLTNTSQPTVSVANFRPIITALTANLTTAINPTLDQQYPQVERIVGSEHAYAALNANPDDPIIYLDYSSLSDQLLRKNTANFVFYNANFNSCRHCSKFFDIWKELAVDIRWWKQVIKLFAINCSDEDNIEACRRAGITQFPQVRFYWINSNSLTHDGQRIQILGKSTHSLRHLITDKVIESYNEQQKNLNKRNNLRRPGMDSVQQSPLSMLMPLLGSSMSGVSINLESLKPLIDMFTSSIGGNFNASLIPSQLISAFMGANSKMLFKRLNVEPIPKNWPELDPIEASDTKSLVDLLPLKAGQGGTGALLIMETQEFLYNGIEVMLDLSPYSSHIYVTRVSDDKSELTKNLTRREDIQAPALIYITASREPKLIATAPKFTNDEDLRRVFVRAFERRQVKYPVKRVWLRSEQLANNGKANELNDDVDSQLDVNRVNMNDLSNALRASLMEQVFRHPDLSDDQHMSLVKYVYAIINYFPFQDEETIKFFKRLYSWLQNQVSPIDIGDYKKQFLDINDYLPQRDWIGCKSISSSKAMPGSDKKINSLFRNPNQIGKVVYNIRKMVRNQQQKGDDLGTLLDSIATNLDSSGQEKSSNKPSFTNQTMISVTREDNSTSTSKSSPKSNSESFIVRIFKTLLKSPLSSDSSILRLIANTLSGGKDFDGAKSVKFAREYPCGAWKLAHAMIVNEYLKESPRKDVRHIVIHALSQYTHNFYTCSMCGNRVSDVRNEFKYNLDDSLRDQSDSVILLWKIHNRINKRLESEVRPNSLPKIQFPSENQCPKCRNPKAQGELTTTPNWHERQVLNYLVHYYRPQNIITKDSDQSASSSAIGRIHIHSLALSTSYNLIALLIFRCLRAI